MCAWAIWGMLGALGLGTPLLAETDGFDPSRVDLAALIECRADVPTYNGFAWWLVGDKTRARQIGLTKVESSNAFLSQYELASPITVFGRQTKTIVFGSSGPLAVLEDVTPEAMAEELKVTTVISVPGKYMGDRTISQSEATVEGLQIRMSVKLNVSNVTSHPGKTLVGCSYRVDVE